MAKGAAIERVHHPAQEPGAPVRAGIDVAQAGNGIDHRRHPGPARGQAAIDHRLDGGVVDQGRLQAAVEARQRPDGPDLLPDPCPAAAQPDPVDGIPRRLQPLLRRRPCRRHGLHTVALLFGPRQ